MNDKKLKVTAENAKEYVDAYVELFLGELYAFINDGDLDNINARLCVVGRVANTVNVTIAETIEYRTNRALTKLELDMERLRIENNGGVYNDNNKENELND